MAIASRSRFVRLCLTLVLLTGALSVYGQDHAPTAVAPSNDRATMAAMQIPSHGSLLNAFAYIAAGRGPHPAVVLLHGFPGNERNLDLAQDIRRAGWNVLYFDYRGSWGTPGTFSLGNSIQDTTAALTYLRQPAVAQQLRLDPTRIVLIGHSMGGFMAVQAAAADPTIKAFATISAADWGGRFPQPLSGQAKREAIHDFGQHLTREGMAPLAGCTPDGLASEVFQHAPQWAFHANVSPLKDRTALVITSDDGLAAANQAFAEDLRRAGDTKVSTLHLPSDHAYSDQRRELSKAILQWLAGLPD